MIYTFIVPGAARGKTRPRFNRAGHAFKHPADAFTEGVIREAFAAAYPGAQPLVGPLALEISAYYEIPASWPKAKRQSARWVTVKPDFDNLAKMISDALNGAAYKDDSAIAWSLIRKCYGDAAQTLVSIWELEPWPTP